jgi:hypothetical protein
MAESEEIVTSRDGSATGSGRRSRLLITPKIAAFAPMRTRAVLAAHTTPADSSGLPAYPPIANSTGLHFRID